MLAALCLCVSVLAQNQAGAPPSQAAYILGSDDQILIRALEAEDIGDRPVRIEMNGEIRLPLIGRVRAAGLTVAQLEAELVTRLKPYVRKPDVTVTITEFRSQPVSVIGCVKNPGVHQLQGRKTLIELLAMAGGLSDDAGPNVTVTRSIESGRIDVPGAELNSAGRYSVVQINLKALLESKDPDCNLSIRPHDVISVPRAEMLYVTGQVKRPGGFVLNNRESLSVLQALSLAGGLDATASPKNARILRRPQPGSERLEIAVDIRRLLAGTQPDVPLQAEDILFVPNSAPKRAALRAVEAAIQVGTGVVIWRR